MQLLSGAFTICERRATRRPSSSHQSRAWRLLGTLLVLCALVPGVAPVPSAHAQNAPTIGGVELQVASANGWPVYYDANVPASAVQNVVAAVELAAAGIPRVTGLPPFSGTVTTYILADRTRFRQAIAEHRETIIDEVSDRANGLSMWRDGDMRMFLKMPEVRSPANAASFVSHELAHLSFAQAAGFRPLTQWLNEGYAEVVRYEVVRPVFPDAAEMILRLHQLSVASGMQRTGGPLPWSQMVTYPRFSAMTRAGFGQMAYGQSSFLARILLDRRGPTSIPDVFLATGRGGSPTEAFTEIFGPFAPYNEAFNAAVAELPARYPPGLYQLATQARTDGIPSLAIVAGQPAEAAVVEILANGAVIERQNLTLDPVGFGRIAFGDAVGPGPITVRVTTPSLGTLERSLVVAPAAQFPPGSTAPSPAVEPARPPNAVPSAPSPAPVQIPKMGGVYSPPIPDGHLQPAA